MGGGSVSEPLPVPSGPVEVVVDPVPEPLVLGALSVVEPLPPESPSVVDPVEVPSVAPVVPEVVPACASPAVATRPMPSAVAAMTGACVRRTTVSQNGQRRAVTRIGMLHARQLTNRIAQARYHEH